MTVIWLRISLYYMEPEGLLPCYQDPAIGLCLEPGKSSPHLPVLFISNPL